MLGQLIVDLLPWPTGSSDRDRGTELLKKVMSDRLYVPETDTPGAIKRALNDSGWLEQEVIAAGEVRQGKEPTVMGMLTGAALVEALRPRRSKAIPKHFVLAVTRDRVVAFGVTSTGDDFGDVYELWVRPEVAGSWPRSSVRLLDVAATAGTLELDGSERLPVYRGDRDPSTEELFALLGSS
jgi:hypothetical protein